jgi:gamma-glutamylcysteine synthetase
MRECNECHNGAQELKVNGHYHYVPCPKCHGEGKIHDGTPQMEEFTTSFSLHFPDVDRSYTVKMEYYVDSDGIVQVMTTKLDDKYQWDYFWDLVPMEQYDLWNKMMKRQWKERKAA